MNALTGAELFPERYTASGLLDERRVNESLPQLVDSVTESSDPPGMRLCVPLLRAHSAKLFSQSGLCAPAADSIAASRVLNNQCQGP